MVLSVGKSYKISKINYEKPSAKALVDMGLTKGIIFKVEKKAPLGDPLILSIREYQLAIRKNDLSAFELERIHTI